MRAASLIPWSAALAVAFGGCGGSGEVSVVGTVAVPPRYLPPGRVAADPADLAPSGVVVVGTGYRTVVPAGWTDQAALFEGSAFRIDRIFGVVRGPRRGQNVVIIREDPKAIEGTTVDELEADVRAQSVEFNNGEVPPAEAPFRMAGEEARRWTSIQTNRGAAKIMRQMIVRRGDALYTITVTTSPKRDDGETILRDLIAAWRWT